MSDDAGAGGPRSGPMVRAYLGLGSNLGDRAAHLQSAVDGLRTVAGVTVVAVSRVYETDPVGGPEQGPFLNAVVALDTALTPHELLGEAQALEQAARRVRIEHWGPRTLDVDVLLYGDETVVTPDLVVPHPRLGERGFVLAPLRDVAPGLVDPDAAWEGVRVTSVPLRP